MGASVLMMAGASGAVLGSAAGSALSRWPRGHSVVSPPRSSCDGCKAALRARDLIPIVSWLILRGRCARCSASIDARLPVLEMASGAAAVGVVLVHGLGPLAWFLVCGAVVVLLATLTDLEDGTIPDRLTLPFSGVAVPAMVLLAEGADARWSVVAWAAGVPAAIEVVARLAVARGGRRPVGGGDVKLLVGLLALASAAAHGPVRLLVIACCMGGIHSLCGLLLGRLRLSDRLPFAPSIAVAFLAVVLLPATSYPLTSLLEVMEVGP